MSFVQGEGATSSRYYARVDAELGALSGNFERSDSVFKCAGRDQPELAALDKNFELLAQAAYPSCGENISRSTQVWSTHDGMYLGAIVGLRINREARPVVQHRFSNLVFPDERKYMGIDDVATFIDAEGRSVPTATVDILGMLASRNRSIDPISADRFVTAARFSIAAWFKAGNGAIDLLRDMQELKDIKNYPRGQAKQYKANQALPEQPLIPSPRLLTRLTTKHFGIKRRK